MNLSFSVTNFYYLSQLFLFSHEKDITETASGASLRHLTVETLLRNDGYQKENSICLESLKKWIIQILLGSFTLEAEATVLETLTDL